MPPLGVSIRLVLIVVGVILGLHFILTLTHEEYGRITSLSGVASHFGGGERRPATTSPPHLVTDPHFPPYAYANTTRANATFVILSRNSNLEETVRSVREMEDRFNRFFGYPYVLLNEELFTAEFKHRVSVLTNAKVEFGLIPREHWFQPSWIDEERAAAGRKKMADENVIYGDSLSYRNMCRFNSGFFFRHDLLQKYRYYWRIEPNVHYHCDVRYDPFLFMQENNKIYGFTITMYEFEKTIKTLWQTVRDFIEKHPQHISENNSMGFLSKNGGETYGLCHFWSNFEIADMDFWRGPAYTDFFNYLDATGGFYYERWGDAPVHSIGAALFARRDQIHFFEDMGYEHNPYTHCPKSLDTWKAGKCTCDQRRSFDYDGYSCLAKWETFMAKH